LMEQLSQVQPSQEPGSHDQNKALLSNITHI
jgi:hypothetical protein